MKTFKTIQGVQFFFDKECTGEIQNGKHDLRVYPNYKGVIVNKLGGVLGMAKTSGKNNINKVVSCVRPYRLGNKYYYSIVCEGRKAYFKLNINLYCFDEITDGIEYEKVIPVERKKS
jgi:hypothetical protein